MTGCGEAHNMLVNDLNRVKQDVGQLYDLDRKQAESMADIKEKVSVVNTEQKHMREDMEGIKADVKALDGKISSVENKVDSVTSKIEGVQIEVSNMNQKIEKYIKKQSIGAKEKALIIVAVFSFISSVLASVLAFLK